MAQTNDPIAQSDRRREDISRRAADKRAQRNYDDARRRIVALEKALALIVGSVPAGGYSVDPQRATEYRQGIDIGRSLIERR
jgi:hypothetical protein